MLRQCTVKIPEVTENLMAAAALDLAYFTVRWKQKENMRWQETPLNAFGSHFVQKIVFYEAKMECCILVQNMGKERTVSRDLYLKLNII